jgi:hypothetical protein
MHRDKSACPNVDKMKNFAKVLSYKCQEETSKGILAADSRRQHGITRAPQMR